MDANQFKQLTDRLDTIIGLLGKKREKTFRPPDLIDIGKYVKERRITNVDPLEFFNHYESVGWVRGKSKVKNWKALVNTWARKGKAPTVASRPSVKEVMSGQAPSV